MKITTKKALKELLTSHFKKKILESVDRSVRGEDKPLDRPEEDEGPGAHYEHLKFDKSFFENLFFEDEEKSKDEDEKDVKDLEETNLYTDSDKRSSGKDKEQAAGDDEDKDKKAKSHAAPSAVEDNYPNPTPVGEGKVPSIKDFFFEVAPPGWEKTVKKMKSKKDIDNPWALAWHMKNQGDKPDNED